MAWKLPLKELVLIIILLLVSQLKYLQCIKQCFKKQPSQANPPMSSVKQVAGGPAYTVLEIMNLNCL